MSAPKAGAPQRANKQSPKKRIDLLRRFAKDEIASDDVTDLGLIKTVYGKAIQFGGAEGSGWRGVAALFALLCLSIAVWTAHRALSSLIHPHLLDIGRTPPMVIHGTALVIFGFGACLAVELQ